MVTSMKRDGRSGYALLATLWICVGIGALTWLISVNARDAMATSRNRMALMQASWNARSCLERARETIRAALELERTRGPDPFGAVWDHVDQVIMSSDLPPSDCVLSARPIGSGVDVNANDEATLARLLAAAGLRAASADSAAAALSDWIDADDSARALGAERHWYQMHGRQGPSNMRFVNIRELRLVRGLETFTRLDSVLDVESGPIALDHAAPEVLSLLPGFTERTVRAIIEARARGTPISTFQAVTALLDPKAPDATAKLPGLVVFPASAWVVEVRSQVGDPRVTAVLEIRLVRGGTSTAIARRRAWVE
jgi:type II secretory pathway component PulK